MLAMALTCLIVMAVSCRTIKEIEYVTQTEYVHDTTEKYIHDSTEIVKTVYDSVDRYVEKTIYIDTNGVVHEREIERLTKYIKESSDEYRTKELEYKSRILELESKLNESVKEVLVEKQFNCWQKTLMWLGVCFILSLIIGIAIFIIGLKKK